MRRKVWVYALIDPRDFKPRYIGQSRHPLVRLGEHLGSCTTKGLRAWRNELHELRARPLLLLLEKIRADWGLAAEEHWIRAGIREGWPLINVVRLRRFKETA